LIIQEERLTFCHNAGAERVSDDPLSAGNKNINTSQFIILFAKMPGVAGPLNLKKTRFLKKRLDA